MATMPPGAYFPDSVPQQIHNRTHESFFGSAVLTVPTRPIPLTQSVYPDSIPQPPSRTHLMSSVFGPVPTGPIGPVPEAPPVRPPGRIPQLKADPRSSFTCLSCGTSFMPSVWMQFTGPNHIWFQGGFMPCCGGRLPPPGEPYLIRGKQHEAPVSGVYLIVEPDDEDA
jgi:hypothetical protein